MAGFPPQQQAEAIQRFGWFKSGFIPAGLCIRGTGLRRLTGEFLGAILADSPAWEMCPVPIVRSLSP